MTVLLSRALAFALVCASGAAAEDAVSSPSNPVHASVPEEAKTVQHFGLSFVLIGSSRTDSVTTEQYVPEGENGECWSQILVYQRILLPEPVATDRYFGLLKRHLDQRAVPPRVRVIQQGRTASLFGLHYPSTDTAGEQFSLALLTVADPKRPNELHLVQFTVNPSRMTVDEMELQVRRWQSRFQSQASALGP